MRQVFYPGYTDYLNDSDVTDWANPLGSYREAVRIAICAVIDNPSAVPFVRCRWVKTGHPHYHVLRYTR